MKRSTTKQSSRFFPRFYGLLPYFLFALMVGNMWFVFAYVRSERRSFDDVYHDALNQVSNVYSFVVSSLSNHVERVRHESSLLSRPMFSPSSPSLSTTNSPSSSSALSLPVDDFPLPPVYEGDVEGYYFSVSGRPFVRLVSGWTYGIGSDFGLGRVDSISPLCIVCSGYRYRLVSSPSRPFPLTPKNEVVSND